MPDIYNRDLGVGYSESRASLATDNERAENLARVA